MYYYSRYSSPVGTLLITSNGSSITGVWMEGQRHYAETVAGEALPGDGIAIHKDTAGWLDRYFRGDSPDAAELPLEPAGSAFRKTVWSYLTTVPYGQTITYGEISMALGCRSAQAIGGAVGHNPISIIIPCHRVVGSGGALTGYAGGLRAKQYLLALEAQSRKCAAK